MDIDFDFAQASITSRFYDKDGTMLENKNFDFENLKAYQSMPSEDTMSPEDCGNSFIDKTGPYQYNCYESETPSLILLLKNFKNRNVNCVCVNKQSFGFIAI